MKYKQNIGTINALIRITCGFTLLAWTTAKLVKKPWCNSYLFLAFMSAMKIGEGIVKYCPITDLIMQQKQNNHDKQPEETDFQEMIPPYTPT